MPSLTSCSMHNRKLPRAKGIYAWTSWSVRRRPSEAHAASRLEAPASRHSSPPHDLLSSTLFYEREVYLDKFLNFESAGVRCFESLLSTGIFFEKFTCSVAFACSCGIESKKKSAKISRTLWIFYHYCMVRKKLGERRK